MSRLRQTLSYFIRGQCYDIPKFYLPTFFPLFMENKIKILYLLVLILLQIKIYNDVRVSLAIFLFYFTKLSGHATLQMACATTPNVSFSTSASCHSYAQYICMYMYVTTKRTRRRRYLRFSKKTLSPKCDLRRHEWPAMKNGIRN
jgi:hypothetical protein